MEYRDIEFNQINDWAFYFRRGVRYSYLVLGNKKALVIDMGLEIKDFPDIVKDYTRDLGIIPVLTHAHHDHRRDAYQFRDGIWVHKEGSEIVSCKNVENYKDLMRKKSSQEYVNPFPTGYYPPEETRIEPGKVLGELREGSIFKLGNRDVLVYETPGHSIDSVSFLVDGILFAGDTVKPSLKQEEVDHYAHFYESDINDYLSSITRLLDISGNIDTICSGHTEPHHGHSILQEIKGALERIADGKSSAQRLNTPWGLVEKHTYNNISIFTRAD